MAISPRKNRWTVIPSIWIAILVYFRWRQIWRALSKKVVIGVWTGTEEVVVWRERFDLILGSLWGGHIHRGDGWPGRIGWRGGRGNTECDSSPLWLISLSSYLAISRCSISVPVRPIVMTQALPGSSVQEAISQPQSLICPTEARVARAQKMGGSLERRRRRESYTGNFWREGALK